MATALDVAEAVASVLPAKRISGAGQQLDDVIRKQLNQGQAEPSVARRTAVTDGKPPSTSTLERAEHSTGLFRKIGADGVSRLEEIEDNPTGVAPPRHTEPMAKDADSGLHRLLDKLDGDRRTEPGAPPTGAAPKLEPTASRDVVPSTSAPRPARPATRTDGKSVTTFTGGTRRRLGLAIGAVVLAGGGFAAWRWAHAIDATPEPGVRDAGMVEQFGVLEIDPKPDGAVGTITGVDGVAHPFGPTPVRSKVSANTKLHVHIEHPGYQPIDDDRTVPPNETLVISPYLVKARAALHVTTTPAGAQVSLDHRVLGETPLVRDDLDPVSGEIAISKPGFEPLKEKVELVAGHPLELTETLKPIARTGSINLIISGTWGNVTFKGVTVASGQKHATLKLPVGRQVLHIANPVSNKQWDVTCTVEEAKTTVCKTAPP
jgi:hypothetical protein